MLIGSKRSSRKEVLETDVDDVQLFEGDVTVGTKDGIPSIRSSDRVHQILYKIMSRTVVVKLLGMEIVDWLTKRTNQSKGTDKVVKESANPKGSRFTALLNLRDNEIDIAQNIMSEFNVK
ncbi:hypothetical protein GOBAR_DD23522 [Gossypium barbadense]|nr:hypothetical protein GOBAR_DD23522 [Gossypium barbadense]